jgi:hypothetical protein
MPMIPDGAAAPRLLGEPSDDLEPVVLLELQIFVLEEPIGLAAAAHVDAHAGIAVPGEIRMGQLIPLDGAVALAVGQILEDRWHRIALGIGGEPDPRREARSVGERDPDVFELPHVTRKPIDRTDANVPLP